MSTADKLNKLLETKEAIKQAIIDKGGTVGDVFADYPTAIQNIQGGGGSGKFVVPAEMRFGQSKFTEFPEDWDWSEIEKVTKPNNLFYYCEQLKEVPKLKFKDLQSGANMFNYCSKVTDIDTSEWNTSNLIDTQYMFNKTNVTTNPPLNTSKVTTMQNMFANCTNLTEIKDLDTSSATRIDSMFNSCLKLQTVSELDCSKLTFDNSSYSSPFNNCYLLRYFGGFKGLKVNMYLDKCYSLSYESLMNVINKLADGVSGKTLYLFQDLVNQLSDDDIAIATSKGWSISPARTITEPVVVTNLNQIPSTTYQITPRTYDFSQFNGAVGKANGYGGYDSLLPCRSYLRYFEGDLSSLNDASGLFANCNSFIGATITNTHNITNMRHMFSNTSLLKIDMSNWDLSNVTNMSGMFFGADIKTLDLSGLNTPKLESLTQFAYTSEIETLDLSVIDTSKVTTISSLAERSKLKHIILGDLSNCVWLSNAFFLCENLESVTMKGAVNPDLWTDTYYISGFFSSVKPGGTFYYNPAYDYSRLIEQLPSTWTAVPLTE